jgi:hypothetical protein
MIQHYRLISWLTFYFTCFYYNPNVGPFGIAYSYLKYGFRMNPYRYKVQLTVGYSSAKTGVKGFLSTIGQFPGVVKRMDPWATFEKSGIEVNNYYGMEIIQYRLIPCKHKNITR